MSGEITLCPGCLHVQNRNRENFRASVEAIVGAITLMQQMQPDNTAGFTVEL